MPTKGFFDTFNPSDVVNNITALSMKKFDIENAKRQLDMASDKWETEKSVLTDNIAKQNLFRTSLIESIDAASVPDETGEVRPDIRALDVIRTGLVTGGLPIDKAVADLVTLESKHSLPMKFVNYLDPADPTKSRVVLEGRETPPAGYVTEGTYRAMKTGQSKSSTPIPTSSSVTEHGGFPIWKKPGTMETVVRKPDGTEETYDPKVHGKEMGTNVSQNIKPGAEPLTKESSRMEGAKYLLTGKLTFTGMSGQGRTAMINDATAIAKERGWTPNMILRMQTDFRAMDKSVTNQRKNYDMMNGFVINMDKQMERFRELYKDFPRSQYRLLNIPIVKLRQVALGIGEEAAAAAILVELGNESGKLSTNSAASIRELSESAQKQWGKIHDNLLSPKEIEKVLVTTKNLGHDRLTSTKDAMDFTLQGIESLGEVGNKPSSTGRIKVDPSKVIFR